MIDARAICFYLLGTAISGLQYLNNVTVGLSISILIAMNFCGVGYNNAITRL